MLFLTTNDRMLNLWLTVKCQVRRNLANRGTECQRGIPCLTKSGRSLSLSATREGKECRTCGCSFGRNLTVWVRDADDGLLHSVGKLDQPFDYSADPAARVNGVDPMAEAYTKS